MLRRLVQALDALSTSGEMFQIVSTLTHGQATRSVSLDDCYITNKEFSIQSGGHGETVYSFSATRVREEDEAATE